jgi:hypothetical protein
MSDYLSLYSMAIRPQTTSAVLCVLRTPENALRIVVTNGANIVETYVTPFDDDEYLEN